MDDVFARGGYEFIRHGLLNDWKIPTYGGVYIIEHKVDKDPQLIWYKPLYIGEAGDLSERVIPSHKTIRLIVRDFPISELYVSTHRDRSESSRKHKEEKLRSIYDRTYNKI